MATGDAEADADRTHRAGQVGGLLAATATWIATAASDQTIRIWDTRPGEELAKLEGHTSDIETLALSPDGKLLASSSNDTTVRLWDVATGETVRVLEGHTAEVDSVDFAPDGKTLASGSKDTSIKLWDVADGKTAADADRPHRPRRVAGLLARRQDAGDRRRRRRHVGEAVEVEGIGVPRVTTTRNNPPSADAASGRRRLRGSLLGRAVASPRGGRDTERRTAPIKACIFIFYYGGPSHLETFDPKPDAPAEVRGEFQSIATSVPGVRFGEHLPMLAGAMHKVGVIRSMHHRMRAHDSASSETLTGRSPPGGDRETFTDTPQTFPSCGAMLSREWRTKSTAGMPRGPPYVMNNVVRNPGQTPGFLGAAYDPFQITGDPATMSYHADGLPLPEGMTHERLGRRRICCEALGDTSACRRTVGAVMGEHYGLRLSGFRSGAAGSGRASGADTLRERYGMRPARNPTADELMSRNGAHLDMHARLRGQNLLLARRLVEAGVPFVNVYDYKQQGRNWDTHKDGFNQLKSICCRRPTGRYRAGRGSRAARAARSDAGDRRRRVRTRTASSTRTPAASIGLIAIRARLPAAASSAGPCTAPATRSAAIRPATPSRPPIWPRRSSGGSASTRKPKSTTAPAGRSRSPRAGRFKSCFQVKHEPRHAVSRGLVLHCRVGCTGDGRRAGLV